jgi:hypothetical protein
MENRALHIELRMIDKDLDILTDENHLPQWKKNILRLCRDRIMAVAVKLEKKYDETIRA